MTHSEAVKALVERLTGTIRLLRGVTLHSASAVASKDATDEADALEALVREVQEIAEPMYLESERNLWAPCPECGIAWRDGRKCTHTITTAKDDPADYREPV